MEEQTVKFGVVGSLTLDQVAVWYKDEVPPAKSDPDAQYTDFGGGGGNAARAIKRIAKARGINADVRLFTKIGKDKYVGPDRQPLLLPDGKTRVENPYRPRVLELLEREGIQYTDLAGDRPHRIPHNPVLCCRTKDRLIAKDREAREVTEAFNSASDGPIEAQRLIFREQFNDLDVVVIFASYGWEAALAAEEAGKIAQERIAAGQKPLQIIVDYDVTKPEQRARAAPVLQNAKFLLPPAEALVGDMEMADEARLVEELKYHHGHVKSVSNGGKDVHVNCYHSDHTIIPGKPSRIIDSLGAGDVKTSAFAVEIAIGTEYIAAARHASRIATFSTMFLGTEWRDEDALEQFVASPQFDEVAPAEPLQFAPRRPQAPFPTPAPMAA